MKLFYNPREMDSHLEVFQRSWELIMYGSYIPYIPYIPYILYIPYHLLSMIILYRKCCIIYCDYCTYRFMSGIAQND